MYPESIRQLRRSTGAGVRERVIRRSNRLGNFDTGQIPGNEPWGELPNSIRQIANQMLAVQESERKRIASDLHDGVGQSLTIIKLSLTEVARLLNVGAANEASDLLHQLKNRVHGALEEVRHVAMDLRPPMLDDLGLLPTLSWFFRELDAACTGMKVEKEFSIHENRIPDQLKIAIFRIVQEATSNIVKYAHADLMRVKLKQVDNALHFTIEDNGDGFDPAEVAVRNGSDRGMGLLSMKERATLSGGFYVLDSVVGKGTQICIFWPLDSSEPW